MQEHINQMNSRIDWLSKERDNLYGAWVNNKIDEQTYQEERNRINGEINGLYFAINLLDSESKQGQKEIGDLKEFYVLLADMDGGLRSSQESFVVAVSTEEEAKRYVSEGGVGHPHSYQKIAIYKDKDEAIKSVYKDYKSK